MPAEENTANNIDSLGWDDLIALKRRLSDELKGLTTEIIGIDKNKFSSMSHAIREQRATIDSSAERMKQVKVEIDKYNAELLSISDKVSQFKNFLGMMESRLPAETEADLQVVSQLNSQVIDKRQYKSEREKNEILSKIKDATMKIEAIKAVNAMKDQLNIHNNHASEINNSIKSLNQEFDSLRERISEANSNLDDLYGAKRQMGADRQDYLDRYDKLIKDFDFVNSRLDAMSDMRKKQRDEYGHGLPADALFKVKETAKKKLQSGSKLTLDELKLAFSDDSS